jgi:hypothetical protein
MENNILKMKSIINFLEITFDPQTFGDDCKSSDKNSA